MKIKDCTEKIRNKHDKIAFTIFKRTIRELLKKIYDAPDILNDVNEMVHRCYHSRDNYKEESLYLNMLCWCGDCNFNSNAVRIVFISRVINNKLFKGEEVDGEFIETYVDFCMTFLEEEHPETVKKYGKCIEDALLKLVAVVDEHKLSSVHTKILKKPLTILKKVKPQPETFYIND